jgi:protocatechuate 4,5-dioxygenase, beta chain
VARLVSIIGVTHNPFMPRLFALPDPPPGAALALARVALMREKLRQAEPDVLLMIGNDHLNQFFMDNMPAFMIGKMDAYDGTFYNEVREFGLPVVRVPGDARLGRQLLEGALDHDVDLAYSDELRLDHSTIVPLLWVRPEMDLPVVPLLTNCIAPPLPRARRVHAVGQALRRVIEELPGDQRIAVVASGHLSLEVGGPKMMEPRLTDPQFDHQAVGWIANNDLEGAARACTFEQLSRSGNMTPGFLNFIMAMGIADGLRPTHAEGLEAGFPATPFFAWEPLAGAAG